MFLATQKTLKNAQNVFDIYNFNDSKATLFVRFCINFVGQFGVQLGVNFWFQFGVNFLAKQRRVCTPS